MAQLGLGSDRAVEVKEHPVVPKEFILALLKRDKLLGAPEGVEIHDWEVCDIELKGTKDGRPLVRHALARFPPRPDWQLTVTEYAVGVAGAVGAELIAAGVVTEKGVVPPERCIPPGPFRAALKQRGIETAIIPGEAPLPPARAGSK